MIDYFIVELQGGLWLSESAGFLGETLFKKDARKFSNYSVANVAKIKACELYNLDPTWAYILPGGWKPLKTWLVRRAGRDVHGRAKRRPKREKTGRLTMAGWVFSLIFLFAAVVGGLAGEQELVGFLVAMLLLIQILER